MVGGNLARDNLVAMGSSHCRRLRRESMHLRLYCPVLVRSCRQKFKRCPHLVHTNPMSNPKTRGRQLLPNHRSAINPLIRSHHISIHCHRIHYHPSLRLAPRFRVAILARILLLGCQGQLLVVSALPCYFHECFLALRLTTFTCTAVAAD